MTKRRRRHSWALELKSGDPELRALSRRSADGVSYARSFAEDARERSAAALAGEPLEEPLSAADLAEPWVSPVEVHAAIKQARIELFGKDLTNSAIAYRMRQRRGREQRICAEPDCEGTISRLAHGRRRYCAAHGSGRARVARHRRSRRATAEPGS